MNTSHCRVCGAAKPPAEYHLNECSGCQKAGEDAGKAYVEKHPDATSSEILYAERMGMSARAHIAHKNYTDPRAFSRFGHIQPGGGNVIPPPVQ